MLKLAFLWAWPGKLVSRRRQSVVCVCACVCKKLCEKTNWGGREQASKGSKLELDCYRVE